MTRRASPRDASWYNNPDVRTTKVIHVDNGDGFALCNSRVPLDQDTWWQVGDVPDDVRCRRRACAAAYEAGTRSAANTSTKEAPASPDPNHTELS